MKKKMTKMEAIKALCELDHAILFIDKANEIAEPFGVKVPIQTFEAGKDRVESFNGKKGDGVGAHVLAEVIADSLALSYPHQFGIGSRLRVACGAVIEYLERGGN